MTLLLPTDDTHLLDFQAAAKAVLAYLQGRLGFDLWMITRTEGNDWIVLQAQDQSYGVQSGDVFRWTDSFCSRMVKGEGPRMAPCSTQVRAYASAPIAQQVPIAAYVGVPLLYHDGTLFGTLCAIDPSPQNPKILDELPLVELLANLLSSILHADMKVAEQTSLAERLQAETLTDDLTGLYNRRGWDYLLAAEERQCAKYGHPAYVAVIDLDNLKRINDSQGHAAGDELLRRTAAALRQSSRQQDVIARVGGDEFTVLFVKCALTPRECLRDRINQALKANGIEASIGLAERHPSRGLGQAWLAADQAMYREKQCHRQSFKGCLNQGNEVLTTGGCL